MAALGWATWSGCSSSSPAPATGGDQEDASPAEGGAVLDATTDVALGTEPDASTPDTGTVDSATGAPPVISNLMIVANPNSVLSATITFTTNVPTTSEVLVTNTGDGGSGNTFTIAPTTQLATSHSVNVLGMRANSAFDLKVTVTDAGSNVATGTVTFTTPALPAAIAPITVVTNDPTKTSPGYTLFTVWKWDLSPTANIDPATAQIVALDAQGQIVWYYLPANPPVNSYPTAPKKLPNGDLAFVQGDSGWAEIDMMGNTVRSYTATAMGLDSLHHEITLESNNSQYLGLSTELRNVDGYPVAGDAGTTTYAVVGDVIAEFDTTGKVLNRWSDFDMLDAHRMGNSSFFNAPYWSGLYPLAVATKDWTHGNSVIEDPSDGTIVASSRTQNWVYKFGRNDGGVPKIVWRLGEGGDFTLTNANETFQYGQHGLSILPNGHLMMFDDGDNRAVPDGGSATQFSRAVEYSLNTASMQATIEWQYRETPPFYSQFLGSSYLLANGNVLICDGGETAKATAPTDPTNLKFARIIEVTHDATPTKVLEYDVKQPIGSLASDSTFSGYSVYRATRLPSLY